MKKLLTLLFAFIWIGVSAQTASVPNHDHFALGHVFLAVYGDSTAGRTTASLFTDSSPLRFNTTYGNRNMNPQLINGFRDYGPRPTVTTTAISSIAETTATGGGNVTSDGGSTVSSRGVCWSTSADPTIADSKTTDGTGTGSFSSSITGLSGGTTYHVRAYAINSRGESYGDDVNFTTSAPCYRPSGLVEIILYSKSDGVTLNSGNICTITPGVLTGEVNGESIGFADTIDVYLDWLGEGGNCTKVPDGYYFGYFNPIYEGDPYYMVYVSGGIMYLVYC